MANHHQTVATTPREMKKSASGVRKAMVLRQACPLARTPFAPFDRNL
jgi:hypothetical protein